MKCRPDYHSNIGGEMTIRVCMAGATGWAGSALTKAICKANDMVLTGAVSRSFHGQTLGTALDLVNADLQIHSSVIEALQQPCDVFVEYTKPESAKPHILQALQAGCHVVVGTSGLTDVDYEEIDQLALEHNLGVLAAGNFALTMVLAQKFAKMAASMIPHCEIIEYGSSHKKDVPSGTVLELANQLGEIRESALDLPLADHLGPKEARGARLNGVQVHALRLPGYVLSTDIVFGMDEQKLIIRHESGSSAQPYVDGAMLAIRKMGSFIGLRRGLDSVMDF